MRAFPGNWMNGRISKMLMKKMKKNIVDQERQEAHPVRADRLQDDALADEVDARLGHVLDAPRHELGAGAPAAKKNDERDARPRRRR